MKCSLILILGAVFAIHGAASAQSAAQKGSREAGSIINRAANEAAGRSLDGMLPASFKVGDFGKLSQDGRFFFIVDRIVSESELIALPVKSEPGLDRKLWDQRFIVRGVSTKGLVDAKRIPLEGMFKVSETAKQAGRTMFVLEVESKEARAKREAEAEAKSRSAAELARKEQEKAKARKITAAKKKIADSPAKADAAAAGKLSLCKQLIDLDKRDVAKLRLQELIRDYPDTKAANEAKLLLKKL